MFCFCHSPASGLKQRHSHPFDICGNARCFLEVTMIFPTFMWCIRVCTMNRDAQPTEEAEQVKWVASTQLETSIGNGSCGEVSLSVVWDHKLSLSFWMQEVFLVYMSLQVLRCAFGFLAGLLALGMMGKAPGTGISHLFISTSGHGWEDLRAR